MHVLRTYFIDLEGYVNIKTLNTASPHQVKVVETNQKITQLALTADQAGLIGLLRHLHQQGFVLISVGLKGN